MSLATGIWTIMSGNILRTHSSAGNTGLHRNPDVLVHSAMQGSVNNKGGNKSQQAIHVQMK